MWASVGGHTDVVQILLGAGADTEVKDNVRMR
jgi:ankyrin repeat protein